MREEITEGIRLFNARRFFQAHEALEAVWLTAQGEEKLFLHGLIQVAAAFHHRERGNRAGFHSLLEKGCTKLARCSRASGEIDIANLLKQLQPWREFLKDAHDHRTQTRSDPPLISFKT